MTMLSHIPELAHPKTVIINFMNTTLIYRCDESDDDSHKSVAQQMYLVFESALLLLFTTCVYCGQATSSINKAVRGTFLRITQLCDVCGRSRIWESQSFIGTVPAGNILLSSAILYSGSLPSKALRMFHVLKCAAIDRTMFFRHQSKYLQPAIFTVWRSHQDSLLELFKAEKKALVVAGDGRADSPGHSAKYGCYTFLELSCNKVVQFKLVQVIIILL